MNYRIVFEDGTTLNQPEQTTSVVTPMKSGREWRQISVIGDVATIKSLFTDNAIYRQEWDSIKLVEDTPAEVVSESGEELVPVYIETIEVQSRDLSEFCIAGEIIDHRDGTCTVLMGKLTQMELMQKQLESMPSYEEMKAIIEEGVDSI